MWPSGHSLILPMVSKGLIDFVAVEESLPRGWGFGGLVGASSDAPDKVAAVYSDLIARRILQQRVCPNPLQGQAWLQATVPGPDTIRCRAHVVDLDGGTSAVWKRFSENARRCIRKAEKQQLEVVCDTTGRLLDVFDDLWSISAQRWAAQQREPAWLVRWRGRRQDSQNRWRQISERLKGQVAIWITRHHGEPVAGIMIVRGPNDHYTRGAMNKELAGPSRANFLLHWLAIQDACQRGARWYQMGVSGRGDDSISRFKENFGACAYDFPMLRLGRLPAAHLYRSVRATTKRVIIAGWRYFG
jgi:lipid II:glycine glycyltransferase (peptidoglycan interpeptide bridge formation enzyme)